MHGTNRDKFFSYLIIGTSVMNIMKPSMRTSELMSALADGQLRGQEFAQALRTCELDESALSSWNTYHLIGDVLRSPEPAALPMAGGAELAFLGRLNKRLAQEPGTHLATGLLEATSTEAAASFATVAHPRGQASNDRNFRWKLVAGLASLAAVSAIAWNASGLLGPASSPQLAQASPAQVIVASPQGPIVRDARLEELLAAHKQLGAASALQGPSGFLRNATFEMPQDAHR